MRISDNIKKEIKQNTDEINNLKENTNFNQIDKEQIKKYINDFLNIENPSRDLIINLVDKIYIYQDKTIDIIYTFKNRWYNTIKEEEMDYTRDRLKENHKKLDSNILDLFRKIICSLLCISKITDKAYLKAKADTFLNEFIKQYESYNNHYTYSLNNNKEIIDFCNECYEDKDVFDYAEDVEYGLKELIEITRR